MKTKKNPYHNFTKVELKKLIEEHNLRAKQRAMMPKLNLNDPQILKRIERGRKLHLKMETEQRIKDLRILKESELLRKKRGDLFE